MKMVCSSGWSIAVSICVLWRPTLFPLHKRSHRHPMLCPQYSYNQVRRPIPRCLSPDLDVRWFKMQYGQNKSCATQLSPVFSSQQFETWAHIFLVLFTARVHSILSSPGETHVHGEAQLPDCSSITDTHNNETLYMLVKELGGHLELKFKMPDDHARQVRCTVFINFSFLMSTF